MQAVCALSPEQRKLRVLGSVIQIPHPSAWKDETCVVTKNPWKVPSCVLVWSRRSSIGLFVVIYMIYIILYDLLLMSPLKKKWKKSNIRGNDTKNEVKAFNAVCFADQC